MYTLLQTGLAVPLLGADGVYHSYGNTTVYCNHFESEVFAIDERNGKNVPVAVIIQVSTGNLYLPD
jgi:hypothetical protein